MLSTYSWLSMALDLAQMVLEVRKNPKSTQFYMLNNFWFNNCLKISIPGDVRAQVLQEPVGASHADQGRKSGDLWTFLDPGGQAGSNGTPHFGFGSSPTIPQGGSCCNIYKDDSTQKLKVSKHKSISAQCAMHPMENRPKISTRI